MLFEFPAFFFRQPTRPKMPISSKINIDRAERYRLFDLYLRLPKLYWQVTFHPCVEKFPPDAGLFMTARRKNLPQPHVNPPHFLYISTPVYPSPRSTWIHQISPGED